MVADNECGQRDGDSICNRPRTNHPNCTGWDRTQRRYRDWPNPDHVPPANTTRAKAQTRSRAAREATAPDERVAGIEAGMAASRASAERWSDEEKAQVLDAVRGLCRARPGGTFTADDVWDALGTAVPITKGLAAVLAAVKREGLCEPTDEHTTARRGGVHDHGQTLRVWVSRIPRIPERSY